MVVVALNKQALGYRLVNYWLLFLPIDLATYREASFKSNFLTFFPATAVIYHPYVSTCDIDEKLSKMVGDSVRPLQLD